MAAASGAIAAGADDEAVADEVAGLLLDGAGSAASCPVQPASASPPTAIPAIAAGLETWQYS
ncbi:MAG: hypothetical protein ACJ72N_12895 [Labedaea sp.]